MLKNIKINSKILPRYNEILSKEALFFIQEIHEKFNSTRLELLEKRKEIQKAIEKDPSKADELNAQISSIRERQLPIILYKKGPRKYTGNVRNFEFVEEGDYVVCAVSGKKIPLNQLTYWNVELQEAYFSPKEAQQRYEELNKK